MFFLKTYVYAIKAYLWLNGKMMSWGRFYPLWDMYLNFAPAIISFK